MMTTYTKSNQCEVVAPQKVIDGVQVVRNFTEKLKRENSRYTVTSSDFQQLSERMAERPGKVRSVIPEPAMVLRNLSCRRSHPFYPEWTDWQETVLRYHSEYTKGISRNINKSLRRSEYFLAAPDDWLVDEIYFQTNTKITRLEAECQQHNGKFMWCADKFNDMWYETQHIFFGTGMCDCEYEGSESYWNFPNIGCQMSLQHKRAHIISCLWTWYYLTRPRRYLRRYYGRLERIVLSLSEDKLNNFTPELITDPISYAKKGRNVLVEMYRRAQFDTFTTDSFVEQCEYLKHFIAKQQSGNVSQSSNVFGESLDEMIEIAERLFRVDDSVMDHVLAPPRQQGMFDFTVKHSWDDNDLTRIRDVVKQAQKDFVSAFQKSIMDTTRNILIMFLIASIVCLLARMVIGATAMAIYKLIHLICGLVCGYEDHREIKASFPKQQSQEVPKELPILPRLITKYVIGPPQDVIATLWNSRHTDLVMRRISYFGDDKMERGIDRITSWVRRVINRTISWFCQAYLGIDSPVDLEGSDHAINDWQAEVDSMLETYYRNQLVWSDATWSVVYNLYSRGLRFTRSPAYRKEWTATWRVVSKLGNLLEQFKAHNKDGQTIRNPPVTIYLYGETGVGKSSLTYPLAVSLLKYIFLKEKNPTDLKKHWKNLIYMRSAEQEYWDGYQNQLVTLFDDFNQQTDSGANPAIELFEIIRASNCFPYPLHMAALEEKATTTFTSKIIIVSSNNKKPRTASLNYPKALERRFDVAVEVKRKPGVNVEKGQAFDKSIYEFDLYDMSTNEVLERGLSFNNLVDKGVEEYFSRRSFVESIDASIDELLDEPVNEMEWDDNELGNLAVQQGPKAFDSDISSDEEDFETKPVLPPYFNENKMQYEEHRRSEKKVTFKDEVPFYKRWQKKLKQWWNPSKMDELKAAVDNLRVRQQARFREFVLMKSKNKYLEKMKIPLALLLGGIAFIALFTGIKKIFKGKEQKKKFPQVLTSEEFERRIKGNEKFAKSEAYAPPLVKSVKVESYSPLAVKTVKVEGYNIPLPRTPKVESQEQGVKDLSAAEILLSIARKNVYKMYESTCGSAIGHVMFLRGRVAVMPRHYLYGLRQSLKNDPDATVYFQAVVLERSFEIRIKDLLKNKIDIESPPEEGETPYSRDLMAMAIPSAIFHQDAASFFCDKNSLSKVDSTEVMLPVLLQNNLAKSNRAVLFLRYTKGKSQLRTVRELPVGNDTKQRLRIVRDAWEYSLDTQATECGAPLIVRNTKICPGKICGIHIAGVEGTGQGFSTPLYREDVEKIVNLFDEKYTTTKVMSLPLNEVVREQSQVPDDAEFIRLGMLDNGIGQPSRTKISKSPLWGKIRQPVTKPTLLTRAIVNGEEFCPRKFRLSKLGNICVPQREELIENAQMALVDEISSVLVVNQDTINNNIKAEYTFDEAVLGIDGERFVNSVKRDTSTGFIPDLGRKVRTDFFGKGESYDLNSEDCKKLRSRVQKIIDAASENVSLDHYFVDTLKDERKPIHKAHKTRLFAAGPLDYLIACKMYFNGIVALLSMNRNKCHISVGTNVYSEDWGQIARVLLAKSKKMVAGDFEGFDASQHQRLLESAGEVLIELSVRFLGTTAHQARIMRVLLISLYNSLHITGKDVYQWTHSLPSGHYLTAIINSVFVNIAFATIWQLAFKEETYLGARSFWKECGIVAYGDDHVVSVPENRLEVFNQFTVPVLFKIIGLSYTMEDKDAIVEQPARLLTEVSYLKRGFQKDNDTGRWIGPMSLDTVLETPMWTRSTPDDVYQTASLVDWSLKELSLHTQEVWEEWSPVIRRAAESIGHYTEYVDQLTARVVCLAQDIDL